MGLLKKKEGIYNRATERRNRKEVSRGHSTVHNQREGLNLLTFKDVVKMRKDKMQQKNTASEQLTLFTRKGTPFIGEASGTSSSNETGVELSSRLEQQRSLTENILERIVDYGTVLPKFQSNIN